MSDVFKPSNVKDLVRAWKQSGKRAEALESRLHQAVEVARRYRRDLLRLAEQNRSRRLQAEGLQQKLVSLLERPAPTPVEPLPPLPEGDEQVPAAYVHQLLNRLRESQDLVAEMETLLEFREKQVHQLLVHADQQRGDDWRVATLQRELTDARHRIRLLTQELSAQPTPVAADASARVAELEARLAEVLLQGDQALASQLQVREQQVTQLQDQLHTRIDELKKAVGHIQQARERIRTLESELEAVRQAASQDESGELLNEITALQDENARLQEESDRHAARASAANPERLAQLEAENLALKSSSDAQKVARLEAALVELRQKLQLAGSKYQEVKAALIEKHQQLVALQSRSQASMEPLVRTLEAALEETRRQNSALQGQLEMLKRKGDAPAAEPSEALASMEAKLKEARRSAVRAQAEAGLKRKEMARLQEEVEALKAKVLALGGSL